MTKWDLADAFGKVNKKFVKETDRLFKEGPTWRYVMTKSIKAVCTTAAVVFTVGIIALVMFLQSGRQSSVPANAKPDEAITLRVVTESTATWDQDTVGNSQILQSIRNIVTYYQSANKGVKIDLTLLPTEKSARETALQKLRTEIMAGKGPDVYLLPTGTIFGDELSDGGRYIMEPLFPDVAKQMRNGRFLDVSNYYDKDTALKTEELNSSVMAVGEVDGSRLILPLGYTIPVLYAFPEALQSMGVSANEDGITIDSLFDFAINSNDSAIAWTIYNQYPAEQQLSFFPNLFDYDADSVMLTAEEIAGYFQKQQLFAPAAEDFTFEGMTTLELGQYLSSEFPAQLAINDSIPMAMDGLGYAADAAGISKSQGKDLRMLPVCASDGSLIAQVTYFGAIDASCDTPETAYDFLRVFLLPEVQFGAGFGKDYSTNISRIRSGWPVRTTGSASAMWNASKKSAGLGGEPERITAIQATEISDEDIPVLQSKIDQVRFPTPIDEEFRTLSIEIKYGEVGRSEGSVTETIEKFITDAKYHIAES